MLDPHGFVATCNSTNFFIVTGADEAPEVVTSDGRYCLGEVARAIVLEICHANGIPARETAFSLTDVYSAREAFVTGTLLGSVLCRLPWTAARSVIDTAGRRLSVFRRCTASWSTPTWQRA